MLLYELVAFIAGLAAFGAATYKIGRWTQEIVVTIRLLNSKIDRVDKALENHLVHATDIYNKLNDRLDELNKRISDIIQKI